MDITFFFPFGGEKKKTLVSAFWRFQGGSCLHAPRKPCNDCARWDMCFLFLSGMLYPCTYGRNQKLGKQMLFTPSCHTSCFQSIVLKKGSFKPRCCNIFFFFFYIAMCLGSFSFLILQLREMEMSSVSPAECMRDCHTGWLPFIPHCVSTNIKIPCIWSRLATSGTGICVSLYKTVLGGWTT